MSSLKVDNVEYVDWSDTPDEEGKRGKYAELYITVDELSSLTLYLRRNSKTRREFELRMDAGEVYKMLKEHFGD